MIETSGDLWNNHDIIITTNGFIKNNGEAVMGRGCAYEATKYLHCIDGHNCCYFGKECNIKKVLGMRLKESGNIPCYLGFWDNDITDSFARIWTFPTKHNWMDKSDMDLIIQSAIILKDMVDAFEVHMPRPGCGNGGLKWEKVKPEISHILDNRFIVHGGK